jgi:hypothetical protein
VLRFVDFQNATHQNVDFQIITIKMSLTNVPGIT